MFEVYLWCSLCSWAPTIVPSWRLSIFALQWNQRPHCCSYSWLKSATISTWSLNYKWSPRRLSAWSANTMDGARLDVAASGFWGRTLMDVRVFNPFAPSNNNTNLENALLGISKRRCECMNSEWEKLSTLSLFLSTSGLAKQVSGIPPCRQVGATI